MAMSKTRATSTLETALVNQNVYIMLHTGDPGANGEGFEAEYDASPISRKLVDFKAPVDENDTIASYNSNEPVWTGNEIDIGEDITHFSIWDNETHGSGEVEFISTIDDGPVTTGSDGASIPEDAVDIGISVYQ